MVRLTLPPECDSGCQCVSAELWMCAPCGLWSTLTVWPLCIFGFLSVYLCLCFTLSLSLLSHSPPGVDALSVYPVLYNTHRVASENASELIWAAVMVLSMYVALLIGAVSNAKLLCPGCTTPCCCYVLCESNWEETRWQDVCVFWDRVCRTPADHMVAPSALRMPRQEKSYAGH